ncbi:uncharacterized protein LOC112450845 isoform X1 [Kryptolebias marmoratus]|uniref:uncharacterized protein LOC112450845 isoform X1 n=1 Tax=Kryptolebias marmoratus TaxID=37003 RepID=UPI000D530205|nr:uncharacterized protein LOC112450845 isoform X1 [Kryptolebias marmoratus]
MRKTFVCDDSIIITIPIGSLKSLREGQLMPENFHCVFKDNYKVFVFRGKPRPLGAAQAIVGVFLVILGFIGASSQMICTVPNVVFLISGMLSCAAGWYPNMHVMKLSFSLNIISFFWSLVGFALSLKLYITEHSYSHYNKLSNGINGLIMSLQLVESALALFLIFWSSKALCRDHFNSLPIILLKQDD